jgi:hypothetical protein
MQKSKPKNVFYIELRMQERCRVEEIKKWGKKTAGNENSSPNDNAYGHCIPSIFFSFSFIFHINTFNIRRVADSARYLLLHGSGSFCGEQLGLNYYYT